MSKKLRLESTVTYIVWQEISVPDDFDTSDEAAMAEMFSSMPYPTDNDPTGGKAEITKRVAWMNGRIIHCGTRVD